MEYTATAVTPQHHYSMENSARFDDSPGSTSEQDTTPSGTPRRMPMLTDSRGSSGETASSGASFTSSHSLEDVPRALKPAKSQTVRHSLTPSLHTSLVSQILTLRREVETSHDFIQRLEDFLSVEKAEKDSLQEINDTNKKELRNVKRQLQSVEDASLLALEELCRERDEAHDTADTLRLRLQEQQKKLHAQQNENNYLHEVWEQERLAWKQDKRRMDLKIEIATARLRAVMEEAAAHDVALHEQEHHEEVSKRDSLFDENEDEVTGYVTCLASPNRDSRMLQRASVGSALGARRGSLLKNMSLADELKDSSEGEPASDFDDQYEIESPSKTAREVRFSGVGGMKARTVQRCSTSTFRHSMTFPDTEAGAVSAVWQTGQGEALPHNGNDVDSEIEDTVSIQELPPKVEDGEHPPHVDALEPSTKSKEPVTTESPTQTTATTSNIEEHLALQDSVHDCNTIRKSGPAPSVNALHAGTQSESERSTFVLASQRLTQDSSPSHLAGAFISDNHDASRFLPRKPPTSVSGKRISAGVEQVSDVATYATPAIPIITVEPPSSRPGSTFTNSVSPWIKDVGCQTEPYLFDQGQPAQQQDQTIDSHLHSVSSSVALPSPNASTPTVHDNEPKSLSAKGSISSIRSRSSINRLAQRIRDIRDNHTRSESEDSRMSMDFLEEESLPDLRSTDPYSVVDEGHWARLRKSLMLSGRYGRVPETSAIQDYASAERESEELAERSHRNQQQNFRARVNAPTPVPEEDDEALETSRHELPAESIAMIERHRQALKQDKRAITSESHRTGNDFRSFFRRPGSSGSYSIASSSGWSRSTTQIPPPHNIPARNSSMSLFRRRGRPSGTESPTPRNSTLSPERRQSARLFKKSTLRKSRSEAVMVEPSIPNLSKSRSFVSESARPAYVAENRSFFGQVPSDRPVHSSSSYARSPSQTFDFHPLVTTTSIAPTASANMLQHSIVDAITATMVGEWMWKYVRKRKTFSFGPDPMASSDGNSLSGGSAVRHKRWVWLSPYERTVLWSHKQPITDMALMGKPGRKLQIQSVIDVADPTLLPRPNTSSSMANPAITNRSIVVLTPTGALKFTATSPERHYLWLTALSFLSQHTSQDAPDLSFLPPGPQAPATSKSTQQRQNNVKAGGGAERKRLWGRSRSSTRSRESNRQRKPLYPTSEQYELNEQEEDFDDGEEEDTAAPRNIRNSRFTRTTSLLSPPTIATTITTTLHPSDAISHANSLPSDLSHSPYDMAADPPHVPRVPTNSPHNPPSHANSFTTSTFSSRAQTMRPTSSASSSLRTLSFSGWPIGRNRRRRSSSSAGGPGPGSNVGAFVGFSSANSVAGKRTNDLRNSRSFTSSVSARSVLGTGPAVHRQGTGFGAFGSGSTSASVSRGGDIGCRSGGGWGGGGNVWAAGRNSGDGARGVEKQQQQQQEKSLSALIREEREKEQQEEEEEDNDGTREEYETDTYDPLPSNPYTPPNPYPDASMPMQNHNHVDVHARTKANTAVAAEERTTPFPKPSAHPHPPPPAQPLHFQTNTNTTTTTPQPTSPRHSFESTHQQAHPKPHQHQPRQSRLLHEPEDSNGEKDQQSSSEDEALPPAISRNRNRNRGKLGKAKVSMGDDAGGGDRRSGFWTS